MLPFLFIFLVEEAGRGGKMVERAEKMENRKGGKGGIGVAIVVMLLGCISAIFIPLSFGQPPAPAGGVTLYFRDTHTIVPGGYGHAKIVQMRANISSGQTLRGGQIAISYDNTCCKIINVNWAPNINTLLSSWNSTGRPQCWGAGYDWIMWTFNSPYPSGTDVLIANLTVQCNNSAACCCKTYLNYTCGKAGCSQCGIQILNATNVNMYPANVVFNDGTFTCGSFTCSSSDEGNAIKGGGSGGGSSKRGDGSSKCIPQVTPPQSQQESQSTATVTSITTSKPTVTPITTSTPQTEVTTPAPTPATHAPEEGKKRMPMPGFNATLVIAIIGVLARLHKKKKNMMPLKKTWFESTQGLKRDKRR